MPNIIKMSESDSAAMKGAHAAAPAAYASLSERVQPWAFAGVVGLSAFLLFSLELLAARLVLPVFGGAPAVWTTGLCFFTGVLFLGYVYAHVVAARIPPAVAGMLQLVLAVTPSSSTFIAPAHVASLRFDGMPRGAQRAPRARRHRRRRRSCSRRRRRCSRRGTPGEDAIRGGSSPSRTARASSPSSRTRSSSSRRSRSRRSAALLVVALAAYAAASSPSCSATASERRGGAARRIACRPPRPQRDAKRSGSSRRSCRPACSPPRRTSSRPTSSPRR